MILAPHAVHAKKATHKKQPRADKAGNRHAKPAHRANVDEPHVKADDELAHAVSEKRAAPQPVMTSTSAAAATPSNAPLNMNNQDLDDEVPGKKQKK